MNHILTWRAGPRAPILSSPKKTSGIPELDLQAKVHTSAAWAELVILSIYPHHKDWLPVQIHSQHRDGSEGCKLKSQIRAAN